jgi:hypothetical protein
MLVISAVGFDFNRMIGRPKEWLQISWDHDRTNIRPGDAFVVLGKKIDGNDIGIVLEASRKDIYSRAGLCQAEKTRKVLLQSSKMFRRLSLD